MNPIVNHIIALTAVAAATKSWWDRLGDSIRATLGPPIKALHQPIDAWLGSLSMTTALGCTIGLFVVAGIWVWSLPKEFIFRGAPSRKWWCDLRIWATVVLLPYIGMYLLFG